MNSKTYFSWLRGQADINWTLWTDDRPVARPLPEENINIYIHTLSGIRTHDPSLRVVENCTSLSPRADSEWKLHIYLIYKTVIKFIDFRKYVSYYVHTFFVFYKFNSNSSFKSKFLRCGFLLSGMFVFHI
jgi:hypothetical protein